MKNLPKNIFLKILFIIIALKYSYQQTNEESNDDHIILIPGKVYDQICMQNGFYSSPNYLYKIELLNKTRLDKLQLDSIYLSYKIKGYNYSYNDQSCYFHSNDNNYYLECCMSRKAVRKGTFYYEKGETNLTDSQGNKITLIFENDYIFGENIFCASYHKINYLDILKGYCKNGAYFFSIDFKNLIDDIKDEKDKEKIKSELLLEFKAKINSKQSKNYCYLENENEKNKYDLSKYKLNCVVPTFENDFELIFFELFSKFLFIELFK